MTDLSPDAVKKLVDVLRWAGVLFPDRVVVDLLPVVDQIAEARAVARAQQELRAMADAIDEDDRVQDARRRGQAQRAVGEARSVVLERADALGGTT